MSTKQVTKQSKAPPTEAFLASKGQATHIPQPRWWRSVHQMLKNFSVSQGNFHVFLSFVTHILQKRKRKHFLALGRRNKALTIKKRMFLFGKKMISK